MWLSWNYDNKTIYLCQEQYCEGHYDTAGCYIWRFSFTDSSTLPESAEESESDINYIKHK